MEPGVEPLGVTQHPEVAPGSDERLLDRVAGQLRVTEDEAGGPVQPRAGIAGKHGEGVMIAATRSLDETSLVHGRLGFGAMVVVLDGYGVGIADLVLANCRAARRRPQMIESQPARIAAATAPRRRRAASASRAVRWFLTVWRLIWRRCAISSLLMPFATRRRISSCRG